MKASRTDRLRARPMWTYGVAGEVFSSVTCTGPPLPFRARQRCSKMVASCCTGKRGSVLRMEEGDGDAEE